jgi:hypothetical protein
LGTSDAGQRRSLKRAFLRASPARSCGRMGAAPAAADHASRACGARSQPLAAHRRKHRASEPLLESCQPEYAGGNGTASLYGAA